MEKLLVSWLLSPSTFVEKQQLFAKIYPTGTAATGSAGQFGADMPSSQDSVEVNFLAGTTLDLFIRTIGDNGSHADGPSVHFDVKNLESVVAAGVPSVTWMSHTP